MHTTGWDRLISMFCSFFLQQNAAIAAGKLSGLPINLKVLGVGDGLTVSLHLLMHLWNLI